MISYPCIGWSSRRGRTEPATKYAAKTRRDVVTSGTKVKNGPPGPPPPNGDGDRTFPMIPDAEVGRNHGSMFASDRTAETMLKIRVNRKNVSTVAATVLLKIEDSRNATPTTAA